MMVFNFSYNYFTNFKFVKIVYHTSHDKTFINIYRPDSQGNQDLEPNLYETAPPALGISSTACSQIWKSIIKYITAVCGFIVLMTVMITVVLLYKPPGTKKDREITIEEKQYGKEHFKKLFYGILRA